MSRKSLPSSELLLKIKEHEGADISIFEILRILREGSFGIVLIVFSVPTVLPIPGIGAFLSIPALFVSLQLIMGRNYLWLPKWVGRKKIAMKSMKKIVDNSIPYLRKAEFFLHPRGFFLSGKIGHAICGIICFLCAVSVAIPFPLTNTIPSIGIIIIALGLLERDGLAIIAGMLVAIFGIAVATTVIYLGTEGAMMVVNKIF